MVPTQMVGFAFAFFWFATSSIGGPLTHVTPDAIPDSVGSLPIEFEGNLAELKTALKVQIEVCQKSTPDLWNLGDRSVTRQQYCIKTLSRMANLANTSGTIEELGRKFKQQFSWYKSKGEERPERLPLLDPTIPFARKSHTEPGVYFTGYHSPHYRGSLTKTAHFRYGIYRMPSGSKNRNYSSKQVRAGKLSGKGLELAWLESALDAYLLGIQGSGFIDYQVGSKTKTLALRYAGSNGKSTRMLSSVLREKKVPEEYTTIPGMRQYYEQRTQELLHDLDLSPNVVFYQAGNPTGSGGALVTPGHSIAVDRNLFRLGTLAAVVTTRPIPHDLTVFDRFISSMGLPNFRDLFPTWKPFIRVAVAQDVGSAINGAGHVDFYWGDDPQSEYNAGMMRQDGMLFFAIADGDGSPSR